MVAWWESWSPALLELEPRYLSSCWGASGSSQASAYYEVFHPNSHPFGFVRPCCFERVTSLQQLGPIPSLYLVILCRNNLEAKLGAVSSSSSPVVTRPAKSFHPSGTQHQLTIELRLPSARSIFYPASSTTWTTNSAAIPAWITRCLWPPAFVTPYKH
jgi:hypothetical protein